MRSGASRASRSVVDRSMREIAQVAVVDADQRRAERQRAAHLGFVVNLDQRVHAETARLDDHRRAPRVVEQRQHDQHRIGSGDPRLGHLARVDEEVLGQDRAVEFAARRGEIVERAAEKWRDRKGRSAHRRPRHSRAPAPRGSASAPDRPGRGRRFLDLEDETRAGLGERSARLRRVGLARRAQRVERHAVEARLELLRAWPRQSCRGAAFSHGSPRRSDRALARAAASASLRARAPSPDEISRHCPAVISSAPAFNATTDLVRPRRRDRRAAPRAAAHSRPARRRRSARTAARSSPACSGVISSSSSSPSDSRNRLRESVERDLVEARSRGRPAPARRPARAVSRRSAGATSGRQRRAAAPSAAPGSGTDRASS